MIVTLLKNQTLTERLAELIATCEGSGILEFTYGDQPFRAHANSDAARLVTLYDLVMKYQGSFHEPLLVPLCTPMNENTPVLTKENGKYIIGP